MRVVGLGVSVLKGAAHQHPRTLEVDALGPVDDRRYAVVEPATGRVLRTFENTGLLAVQAGVRRPAGPDEPEVLVVDVPGHGRSEVPVRTAGTLRVEYWGRWCEVQVLAGPEADRLSAALATYLGRDVAVVRAGRRDVVYAEALTLVTTSSLQEVERRRAAEGTGGPARDLPALLADAERWRAAVVVATEGMPAFVEDGWHGRRLRLGDGLVVQVTAGVARCSLVRGRPRVGGNEDWNPLKLLTPDRLVSTPEGREIAFAVGAEVVVPGVVALGDEVALVDPAPLGPTPVEPA